MKVNYNPASQITSVTRSNDLYAWTGHSNANLGSTPNGLNQIGNVGAKTVTHDSKGNITAVGADSYGYSSENFLTSGPGSAILTYDPMGRLYQVAQGASTTRMGYDGLDRIAEYSASNAIQRRYIHGPGVDNPIAWYEGTGITTRRFLSSDERGSVISVTDGVGAVLNLNKYDEYGVPQSTNLGKFGYTGQAWVPEISRWYFKARFLWSDGGRFMQTDPIGYAAGPNLYAYVGNDPLNGTDPTGLHGFTGCQHWQREIWHNQPMPHPGGRPPGPPDVTETFAICSFLPPNLETRGWDGGGDRGDRGSDSGEHVLVEGKPRVDLSLFNFTAVPYLGPTFCPGATGGRTTFRNPFGRVNTGKIGGFDDAMSDVDLLANSIGIAPLSPLLVGKSFMVVPFSLTYLGQGWWLSNDSVYTRATSFQGLQLRTRAKDNIIRVDIPAGSRLPSGQELERSETCHYR